MDVGALARMSTKTNHHAEGCVDVARRLSSEQGDGELLATLPRRSQEARREAVILAGRLRERIPPPPDQPPLIGRREPVNRAWLLPRDLAASKGAATGHAALRRAKHYRSARLSCRNG